MSLKALHVLFITASTALALFVGFWGVKQFMAPNGGVGHLALGILSFASAVALLVYGRYFMKKLKHISYL